ncbi:hypothetical protein FKM82_023514, partial [Ascaphus truei]
ARVVNQYTLDITGSCAGVSFNGQIFVMVTDDVPEPQCEEKFSSQVGDTVQVYANLPASSPVYKVVLRQPKLVPATVSHRHVLCLYVFLYIYTGRRESLNRRAYTLLGII